MTVMTDESQSARQGRTRQHRSLLSLQVLGTRVTLIITHPLSTHSSWFHALYDPNRIADCLETLTEGLILPRV